MQAITKDLSCSQGVTVCHSFDLDLVQQFKKVRHMSMANLSEMLCGEQPCRIKTQCLRSYKYIHNTAWLWVSFTVQKGCTKVNVKLLWDFGAENFSVKLQQDVCNSWEAIMFRRPFDVRLNWKFKKVIQRPTSN